MRIDWISKLRRALQVWAFGMVIATIQYAFMPDKPYAPLVAYSVLIGTFTWGVIDIGREFVPSARETGWPPGAGGFVLVVAGIVTGYVVGTWLADMLCLYYGWYPPGALQQNAGQLRTSLLITGLAGIAGSYYFYSINKSAYLERKMVEANRHANEARLKVLETQLEPHMLFNTLANLRVLIGVDAQAAQAMLDRMIDYLRATLAASRGTTHPLQAEADRLRDYLELMAVRMGPRLSYSIDLPPDLAQHPVPTLLLQPIVENSIQHGLEPKVQGGSVNITARHEAGMLLVEVADTGVGPGHQAAGKHAGFGMEQVRERLATLYGGAASMEFGPGADGGARTLLRIPLVS